MVDPAGMWPGAGSDPDGRRLATQAGLASTALLPLSAAGPDTTPEGDGTALVVVMMTGADGPAVPHAVMRTASRQRAAQRTLSPQFIMDEQVRQECALGLRIRPGRRQIPA
jgi:hypothetical protein